MASIHSTDSSTIILTDNFVCLDTVVSMMKLMIYCPVPAVVARIITKDSIAWLPVCKDLGQIPVP